MSDGILPDFLLLVKIPAQILHFLFCLYFFSRLGLAKQRRGVFYVDIICISFNKTYLFITLHYFSDQYVGVLFYLFSLPTRILKKEILVLISMINDFLKHGCLSQKLKKFTYQFGPVQMCAFFLFYFSVIHDWQL